ncbi:hypothetical protein Q8A67_005303 [Cirrhinus molitorella]|uniref:Uncharacterized protein n=1 Tax=Cirrhinus molitorella TaxID=172907 RepID=A0AA88TUJ4_9TELE|nr:hypothetical protein Q8A67_005303 [Cirrhinus molitorella]
MASTTEQSLEAEDELENSKAKRQKREVTSGELEKAHGSMSINAQTDANVKVYTFSGNVIHDINFYNYNSATDAVGVQNPPERHVRHVRNKSFRLAQCHFGQESCMELASALRNISHHLRELDLSGNDLQDSGLHKLLQEMENPEKKLQVEVV